MLKVFTPYARISERTQTYVALVQAAMLIGLWGFVSVVSPLIPGPLEVWDRLIYQISERGLFAELWVSFTLNLKAIAIAAFIALALAYGYVLPVIRPIAKFVANMRFLGIIGFTFVFFIFIADTHWVKVAVLVFGMLPYLTAPLVEAVATIEEEQFHHARSLKLGHWGTTWQVIVRGQLDQTIEAVRQNASIGWMMVAMVEGMLRTEGGVGVMLVEQSRYLRMADLFAIILVIFMVGALQDFVIRKIRDLACPHAAIGTRSFGS